MPASHKLSKLHTEMTHADFGVCAAYVCKQPAGGELRLPNPELGHCYILGSCPGITARNILLPWLSSYCKAS